MKEVARVAHHPARWADRSDVRIVERLGGDDVAADGDHAAPESRHGSVRVPVGRHEHVPGREGGSRRDHREASLRTSFDVCHSNVLVDLHSGRDRCTRERGKVSRGMDASPIVRQESAVETVRLRLLRERIGCEQHRGFSKALTPHLLLRTQPAHRRPPVREVQPTAFLETRVGMDRCGRCCHVADRVDARSVQRHACYTAVPLEPVDIAPQARVDHAGVAPTCAASDRVPVDHDHALPVPSEGQRRAQTGVARADDRHVRLARQGRRRNVREACVAPPHRLFAIVVAQRHLTSPPPDTCGVRHNLLHNSKLCPL